MRLLDEGHGAKPRLYRQLAEKFLNNTSNKKPSRQLALFTCMDTRLVDFLEPAMGIARGEVKVIKNAGNSVTGPFESTIRSLVIGIFELGVKEVMVVSHRDCGMCDVTSGTLVQKMLARGISADAIKMVEKELEDWIDHFHHPRIMCRTLC